MAAMADRWTDEVKSIHATHQQEKKELAEVSFMYLEAQLIYNLWLLIHKGGGKVKHLYN